MIEFRHKPKPKLVESKPVVKVPLVPVIKINTTRELHTMMFVRRWHQDRSRTNDEREAKRHNLMARRCTKAIEDFQGEVYDG